MYTFPLSILRCTKIPGKATKTYLVFLHFSFQIMWPHSPPTFSSEKLPLSLFLAHQLSCECPMWRITHYCALCFFSPYIFLEIFLNQKVADYLAVLKNSIKSHLCHKYLTICADYMLIHRNNSCSKMAEYGGSLLL